MSQKKKPAPPAAAQKAPRSNHSASGAVNRKECSVQDRHPSLAPSSNTKAKERSTESQEHHDQVKNLVSSGTPVLILLRGLPGSGKSTLSKQLLTLPAGKSGCVCSADDFFLVPHGGKGQKEYRFDPLKLEDAHKHCRVQVLRALAHGVTPIVVDNTNTQAWEMLPYVEMALEPWKAEDKLRNMIADGTIAKRNICNSLGPSRNSLKGKKCNCGFTVMDSAVVPYQVELLEPLTWWYRNPSRLAKVNQHGVSQRKITQMLSHFEYGLTGKDLIKQILKKKPQKNHTLQASSLLILEQQNQPSVTKVKPSKGHKPSDQYTGSPLFTNRINNQKAKANHIPNQFSYGKSQFEMSSTNTFPNFVGLPIGSYAQPVHLSPNMLNVGSVGQPGVPKSFEVESMGLREEAPLTTEASSTNHSTSNLKIFPGVQPSNLFSSQGNEFIDSEGSSYENISSKSSVIGPNPFVQSMTSTSSEDISNGSNLQGQYIEISEEEERQWTHANASKYENWKSSEEESEDEELRESSEPKPSRSYWHRHARLMAAKITGEKTGETDCKIGEGKDRVPEWVTDEVDHLASWNIPSSVSNGGDQKASNESEEQKHEGPLPPRSPKKRLLMENPSKETNEAEQSEKITNIIEGHEFGWVKDIRLLLKALGLDKDKSNSTQPSSNDNESTSSTVQANVEDIQECNDPTPVSIIQDEFDTVPNPVEGHEKMESAPKSLQVDEKLLKENSLTCKAEEKVEIGSSSKGIHEEHVIECLPPLPTNVPLLSPLVENMVVKPIGVVGNSSIGLIEKNELLTNLVADQMENFKIIISNIQEASVDNRPDSNYDELHCSDSELSNCGRKKMLNKCLGNVFEEAKDISSEKSDHDVCKYYGTRENETRNLTTVNSDICLNSGDHNETILLHDKTEPGKMTVLKSLLMGIEKAQKRSPEEFESSVKLLGGAPIQDSKSEMPTMQLEAEIPPLGSDSMLRKDEPSSECHKIICKTYEGGREIAPTISTEVSSKELKTTGEPEELVVHVKEQCDLAVIPPPSDISTFVGESLCNSIAMRDTNGSILPSLINLSIEDSSLATIEMSNNNLDNKTDNLLEFNLLEGENRAESFIIVTKEDALTEPGCSYPLSVLNKCDEGSPSINNLSNETKTISDFSIEEVWMSLEHTEQIDKIKNLNQIPSENPPPITAQNIFENTGKFLLDSVGHSDQKSLISDSISSEMCCKLETPKILKRDNGIEDFVSQEEPQSRMNTNALEVNDLMDCDDNDSETYPLVLDHNFVDHLYRTFGNPFEEPLCESPKLPSGSASGITVNIPGSLARKLHECLLKSQWDSILAEEEISQKMLIEDELLARELQELEKEDLKDARESKTPSSTTPNLREIMDMEMAMAMYKADQSEGILNNQRNDMSTRLTWDLLVKEFPQVPQNIIAQIFSAYDYSYANTREALITSLPEYEKDSHARAVKEVVSPEAIAAQEKALMEKVKMESLKYQQREMVLEEESEEIDEEAGEDKGSWREMVEDARKSAALNRRLQKERHAQAQAANRSGMASAAAYYCQMATLHKQKAEEDTRKAANILSKVFTGRYGSSQEGRVGTNPLISPPPTLDMHSMKVSEAVTVMNAFLDAHIECLQADKTRQPNDTSRKSSSFKTKTLFLVTGRGLNSIGGIPRIKPAVEKQLEMRGVWYEEMNPGLLRVMISANQATKRKVG